ncbi:MAG TPA: RNA polymerase sigma factor [Cellvibrio sp.]|nr:RNA polymerase sigma factor [Cellvibrio sp.]
MNQTTTTSTDESELITKLIRGDDQAFRQLIALHHSLMLHIARAIAGDVFADDVVQEAWVSVYKNIATFEHRSSLKTWLLTIVSNQAKARLRKESRQVSLDQLDGETPGSYLDGTHFKSNGHWQQPVPQWNIESPDALLEEQQLQHCINRTLNLLPPTQKAAFILRDIEQHSFEDICNILTVSAVNVRVLVHRARLTLMQVIDRYQETGSC